jgi:hypothetical protein
MPGLFGAAIRSTRQFPDASDLYFQVPWKLTSPLGPNETLPL